MVRGRYKNGCWRRSNWNNKMENCTAVYVLHVTIKVKIMSNSFDIITKNINSTHSEVTHFCSCWHSNTHPGTARNERHIIGNGICTSQGCPNSLSPGIQCYSCSYFTILLASLVTSCSLLIRSGENKYRIIESCKSFPGCHINRW